MSINNISIEKKNPAARALRAYVTDTGDVFFETTQGTVAWFDESGKIVNSAQSFTKAVNGAAVTDLLYEGDKVKIKL